MAMCYEFKLIFKFVLSSCLCRRQYAFGDFQKQLQCFKSEKKKSLINIDFIKRMDNVVRHKQVAAKNIYFTVFHSFQLDYIRPKENNIKPHQLNFHLLILELYLLMRYYEII